MAGSCVSKSGWFVQPSSSVIWGYAQHNGWWGGLKNPAGWWSNADTRPNITRRADTVGPGMTEDLNRLTDAMVRFGYPGFEHNYGLWYDRRRDTHDADRRNNNNAVSPLLEQPWQRSDQGQAWDGRHLYDLSKYNPWYFQRLREMAALCDRKGAILFVNHYMQHSLLEIQAHYCDFPWRPANCVQKTSMPDSIPAANAFYDVSHPIRRDLHKAYIEHCLDELSTYRNVVHLTSEEYTGNLSFMQFWLDTVDGWQKRTRRKVCIGLGATKDVLDAVLGDPMRSKLVSVVDLRYWHYKPDGQLSAPPGGQQVAGRYAFSETEKTTPQQIYQQVAEYRRKYPQKALIHQINASLPQTLAYLMGGGSMLIRPLSWTDASGKQYIYPKSYEMPPTAAPIQHLYQYVLTRLKSDLPFMAPDDTAVSSGGMCLARKGRCYLVYAPDGDSVALTALPSGSYSAEWFNPETGAVVSHGQKLGGASRVVLKKPQPGTHMLLVRKVS